MKLDTMNDYLQLLFNIKACLQKFELTMIAYCLMPNHYHFLVRQDGALRAGLLPQHLFNSYAKSYNHRYKHSGTIFEGNYRVKLVDRSDYLLHLCRYIHANPVKDGIAANLTLWPYSNYLEWIEARGTGTVYALTTIHPRPPLEPYNVALVDLAEGVRMMSRVDGIAADEIAIGSAVVAAIAQTPDGPLVVFHPA